MKPFNKIMLYVSSFLFGTSATHCVLYAIEGNARTAVAWLMFAMLNALTVVLSIIR